MQLSPLQSRLAASVIASCLLFIVYLLLFSPQFALAEELDQPIYKDYPPESWAYETASGNDAIDEALDLRNPSYEPDFHLFDRSIIGRVADGVTPLTSNEAQRSNIDPGNTISYVFEASSVSGRSALGSGSALELRKTSNDSEDDEMSEVRRRESSTLFLSANTCDQPDRNSPTQTTMDPPQLTLYVSTSSENTTPGPGQNPDAQDVIVFTEGAVMYNITLDRDIYLSIGAPEVSDKFFTDTRPYNFEVAASTDEYYHAYDTVTEPDLIWVDSDASASLLTTGNLTNNTDQIITDPPYTMFAQNTDNVGINGIRNSYCGLSSWAQIRMLGDGTSSQVAVGMKKSAETNLTTQEFYLSGLNASSKYSGILARISGTSNQKRQDGSSGGGSVIFRQTEFDTKPNGACTFIFNLTLCTDTQYAVPGNPSKFNASQLAAIYDNYTQTMYDNFDKTLQQTPCQAGPTKQYSLMKNCDDCKTAYKNWLCSVAIPRCEDFYVEASSDVFLQKRNINAPFPNGSFVDQSERDQFGGKRAFNSSRNAAIDDMIQPGPYQELLPCDDLCYDLIRSCPSSMGFGCPLPADPFSFNTSYGIKKTSLSCNYPGSAHYRSGASGLVRSWLMIMALLIFTL
ncbi:stretch-activated Ca2+-permeable channel component-domain-containing protein [Xylariaceae sp. FL0016]|nr:stretch-activated Ca2+-permeable channel component-domain-containing protein [Xylariaceae sp. FL0016]